MLLFEAIWLLVTLGLCSFTPGFYFIRKLRWSPLEKLCASVGLSLILVYLASTAIYWVPAGSLEAGLRGSLYWMTTALAVLAAVYAEKDIRKLAANHQVRRVLAGFAFLVVWTLSILGTIRHYSGAGWSGDWLEHFHRSLFFLHHFPLQTPIYPGGYSLPARPPMMNLLSAFFLAQTDDRFELHQIISAFLNVLAFLPCSLLVIALWKGCRRRILPLTAFFALNPVFIQNATYPWTKLFAASYILLSLWFYLAGLRKQDKTRIVAAFVALSAGVLVHYSAGPYILFVAIHYGWHTQRIRGGRRSWNELAAVLAASVLLLSTWFGWSLAVYGLHGTLASNTSVTPVGKVESGYLRKIEGNAVDTVVPYFVRTDAPLAEFEQQNRLGRLRDLTFLAYQANVVLGIGACGGFAVVVLLGVLFWRRRHQRTPEQVFWVAFIPVCFLVGVAVVGERDHYGVAHLTLQSLVLLGITLLAAALPKLRRIVAYLLVFGCVVDFGLGIGLQVHVESMENGGSHPVFGTFSIQDGRPVFVNGAEPSLSRIAWSNWFEKHRYAACGQMARTMTGLEPPSERDRIRKDLDACFQDDQVYWYGWHARHGGEVTFLGDRMNWHIGRLHVFESVILLMFLGLLVLVLRDCRQTLAR